MLSSAGATKKGLQTYIGADRLRAIVLVVVFAVLALVARANLCTYAHAITHFDLFDLRANSDSLPDDLMPIEMTLSFSL